MKDSVQKDSNETPEDRKKRELYDKRLANLTGRRKGTPNKVTTEFRDTVRRLLEDNAENVATWLSAVAEKDPAKALDLLTRLAEFAAPKLSRTEVAGDKDNPLTVHQITRTIIDPLTIQQSMKEVKEIE